MYLIVLKTNRAILAVGNNVEPMEQGIKMDDVIYPQVGNELELYETDLEIPDDFKEYKYKFVDNTIAPNPDWKTHINPEERIAQLEQELITVQTENAAISTDLQALIEHLASQGIPM